MKKLPFSEPAEKFIFRLGYFFFALEIILIVLSAIIYPELFGKITAIITASLVGGRAGAILAGMELKFHPLLITILLFTFNSIWLLVFYPLFVSFYEHGVEPRILGGMLSSTKRLAEIQKRKVIKIGNWGLPFFVWLPFPWTGAVVGSIIGFLMGMPAKRIMLLVIPSMLIGIVSWTFGFKYLFILTGTVGKIISIFLVGIILISSLLSRFRLLHKA
ncbi:MAG: small multi-drug export protein [bacterium]